ncbi:MAG: hypothetical protein OJJ54_20870 [Pseudonocardia sp.]|nr:hypothetical protein [Pseudonocardia sp.]
MTMTWGVPIEVDRALSLPLNQVALEILRGFSRGGEQHRHNFLNGAMQAYGHNNVHPAKIQEVTRVLAEAYDWLILNGLLSGTPGQGDWLFITRRGKAVLDREDGVEA